MENHEAEGIYWGLMRLMILIKTHRDSCEYGRIMETHETQGDYWTLMRLKETAGDS